MMPVLHVHCHPTRAGCHDLVLTARVAVLGGGNTFWA
jgi:hypothetical protein